MAQGSATSHAAPVHPRSHSHFLPPRGPRQLPWPEQPRGQPGTSQRSPVHPGTHSHSQLELDLGAPWTHTSPQKRDAHVAPAHPCSQKQLPFTQSPWPEQRLQLSTTSHAAPAQPSSHTQRPAEASHRPCPLQKLCWLQSASWHASPLKPGLQRHSPASHATKRSGDVQPFGQALSSHASPVKLPEQRHLPPRHLPRPEQSDGQTRSEQSLPLKPG